MALIDEIYKHLSYLGVNIEKNTEGSTTATIGNHVDDINSGEVVATVNIGSRKYVILRVDPGNNQVLVQDIESGEETIIDYNPDMKIEIEVESDGEEEDEEEKDVEYYTSESVLRAKLAYKYINDGKYKGKIRMGEDEYIISYIDPTKWTATTEDGKEITIHPNQLIELV